jgi:phage tail-like protein
MAFDPKRSATTGRFALELDGYHCAYIKSISGGEAEADVATHDHGPMNMQTKQMANFKFTPIKAKVGIAQAGAMNDWIKASFDRAYATKSGAVIAGDFNYKATHRIDFVNALITSVTIPKLDGSSKEAGYIDVEWESENVLHTPGKGEDIKGDYGTKQKQWTPSMFKFDLAGLTDACKRVATIDSFTWKQAVVTDQIGAQRIMTKHPAKVTVPDVKITLSAADFEPWRAWAQAWFQDGKCLASDHKDGTITFLSPDMKTEIGHIELKQCGLKKVTAPSLEANKEEVARVTVELFVEEMKFAMSGGAIDH